MEEKTNIETLRDFARKAGRNIEYTEQHYPNSGMRFEKAHRTVYIPNNSSETSFYVCYSDPYLKPGIMTACCGVFIPLSIRTDVKINVRKKDILDKLNPFAKSKTMQTGSTDFDSKTFITGNDDASMMKVFSNTKIQNIVIESLDIADALQISVNEANVDFVPGLKGKSYLAIFNPQEWYLDCDVIEKLFKSIEKIRNLIISKE